MREAAERITDLIDPDWALREVARLAFSDVGELFDEHGRLRPVHDLPDQLAAAIASITIVRRQAQVIQTVRLGDKTKVLGMLLEYFRLLKERAHLSDHAALVARLGAGRTDQPRRSHDADPSD